ncbi:MAG: PaaI family thioesterase [Planctomycetaceae bacterium]
MSDKHVSGIGGRVVPFLDHLHVKPTRNEDGSVEFHLKVEHQHLRPLGIIHGGVIASMLDTALGQVVGATAKEDQHVVTVQLNINYIRPTWEGEEIIARGELQHRGTQTAVSRGEIRSSDNQLIATATGTFMFLPVPKSGKMEKTE